MMIEGVCVHGANQADIVRTGSRVRKEIRVLRATLTVRFEDARAAQYRSAGLDERELDLLRHGFGQRLALPLLQLRFWIEQIHLAGRAFHEQEDDILRLRREM